MVSGLDLVEWMLRLQVPGLQPPELAAKTMYEPSGWAIEVRLNAENPFTNFTPSSGALGTVSFPPGEAPHNILTPLLFESLERDVVHHSKCKEPGE